MVFPKLKGENKYMQAMKPFIYPLQPSSFDRVKISLEPSICTFITISLALPAGMMNLRVNEKNPFSFLKVKDRFQ